jgi:hypothetical protein
MDPSFDRGWVRSKSTTKDLAQSLGGRERFDRWFVGFATGSPDDVYGARKTAPKASLCFFAFKQSLGSSLTVRSGQSSTPFDMRVVRATVLLLESILRTG